MRSFTFWWKVSRPHHCLAAALGAWIAVLLSDGSDYWSVVKLGAALSLCLGCLGASIYHYGAANTMYARKYWDRVDVRSPILLTCIGAFFLLLSVAVAIATLPHAAALIVVYNFIAVVCYARFLAKHWTTKNLVISCVCVSPILVGWLSGHRLHPAVPFGIFAIFFGYWAREIIKDIDDLEANNGIRVTLPMQIGVLWARRIAGGLASLSVLSLVALGPVLAHHSLLVILPYALSFWPFGAVAHALLFGHTSGKEPTLILAGTWLLIVSFLTIRLTL